MRPTCAPCPTSQREHIAAPQPTSSTRWPRTSHRAGARPARAGSPGTTRSRRHPGTRRARGGSRRPRRPTSAGWHGRWRARRRVAVRRPPATAGQLLPPPPHPPPPPPHEEPPPPHEEPAAARRSAAASVVAATVMTTVAEAAAGGPPGRVAPGARTATARPAALGAAEPHDQTEHHGGADDEDQGRGHVTSVSAT